MKPFITLLAFVLLFSSSLYSQIRVYSNSTVGIGTTPTGNTQSSKVLINDDEQAHGLKLYRIFSSSSPSGIKYGIYNQIQPYEVNFTYGIRNDITGGRGGRVGIYNYLTNDNTSSWSYMVGMYNRNINNSVAPLYGIYNLTYRNGTGSSSSSLYNFFSQISSNSGGYNGGIRNRIYLYGGGSFGYGIHNEVRLNSTSSGSKYGIYNVLRSSGTGTRYALHSEIQGVGYAGYFVGDVAHNGTTIWTSDRQLKGDIRPIENAVSLINDLNPTNYLFRSYPDEAFGEQRKFGFLAQELEEVLPSLIHELEQPGKLVEIKRIAQGEEVIIVEDEDGIPEERTVQEGDEIIEYLPGDPIKLKGVSYLELIPILTKAIQEQQATITAQQALIQEHENTLQQQQRAINELKAAVQALQDGN